MQLCPSIKGRENTKVLLGASDRAASKNILYHGNQMATTNDKPLFPAGLEMEPLDAKRRISTSIAHCSCQNCYQFPSSISLHMARCDSIMIRQSLQTVTTLYY